MTSTSSVLERLKSFYLTVDLRSLALYRILLGLLLLYDTLARWPDLEAFYTSNGVLPIENVIRHVGRQIPYSVLSGATTLHIVQILFALGGLFYLSFFLGYRTR